MWHFEVFKFYIADLNVKLNEWKIWGREKKQFTVTQTNIARYRYPTELFEKHDNSTLIQNVKIPKKYIDYLISKCKTSCHLIRIFGYTNAERQAVNLRKRTYYFWISMFITAQRDRYVAFEVFTILNMINYLFSLK